MPFVPLTLSDAFGSRTGTTGLTGSLNPAVVDGVFNAGADIGAGPPLGVITTTTSWGFNAGRAPAGTTSLVVTANGATREWAQTFTAGFGGFASADAGISITIEELRRVLSPGAPAGGPFHGHRSTLSLVRTIVSPTTPFIHIWSVAFGLQLHDRGVTPYFPLMVMPITTGLFYRCWFNVIQSATCQAVTGPAGARCVLRFGMTSAFFAFN